MKPDKDAIGKLTLRQCFERHYDQSEITPQTVKGFRYLLTRWERLLPENPPVKDIDEDTLDRFRTGAIEEGLAPGSINSSRRMIRAVLRRLGPQMTGNPRGMGVLDRVPWMRPVRATRGLPKRVSLEDLSRFYLGCRVMQRPGFAGPAQYFWQALLVTAFCTGLRKSDLFALRFADIDLEAGELAFQAIKTQKANVFPLHRVAVEHLRRIQNGREYVFRCHLREGGGIRTGGGLTKYWREILQAGGVSEPFGLHDIRRTAASEIERVRTGMAKVFLQHAPAGVTDVSYLNMFSELRECVDKMRMPVAFTGGVKLAERQLRKSQDEAAALMRSAQLAPPVTPRPEEWRFSSGGFEVRGRLGQLKGQPYRALQALALAGRPLTFDAIVDAVYGDAKRPDTLDRLQRHVHGVISYVRHVLRLALYLPMTFDPVPCLNRGGGNATWAIYLPSDAKGGAA